jgi:thiamine pyrophosphokinase
MSGTNPVCEIILSNGTTTIVDPVDYDYLSMYTWHCVDKGAARHSESGGVLMHRVINKTPYGFETDHINGDRLDNRQCNLRTATHQQNQINRHHQKNNTSGVIGVNWNKNAGKWQACIKINGKNKHLGYFSNKNDAINTRMLALQKRLDEVFYGNE